ncbi:hypothetical protein [Bacillus paramycoides]|uniref:hypothetical protein n=1 Tax=Bacillus paramycoides TaxID=2026194 RepID=UPI002E1C5D65|nr:hypothetical protein [Bacillus paramycoides]MED0987570.1 hypothetical protein [Bacillus paramycoides]MED1093131.1 hypothetical protein [Bacillus paramycoides]
MKENVHIENNIEELIKLLDQTGNPKAKAEITKNIEKSYSKIAVKIEKEQAKQADAIAKENKKVDQNADLTLAQTEKNNH